MLSPTRRPNAAPEINHTQVLETGLGHTQTGLSHKHTCTHTGTHRGSWVNKQASNLNTDNTATGFSTVKMKITDDEDWHEGSTGHWDGGGQSRHPELRKKDRRISLITPSGKWETDGHFPGK